MTLLTNQYTFYLDFPVFKSLSMTSTSLSSTVPENFLLLRPVLVDDGSLKWITEIRAYKFLCADFADFSDPFQ